MKRKGLIRKVENADHVIERLSKGKKTAFQRYPLLFALLAAFGLVITNNGIQGLIAKVSWLNRNPVITLVIGVIILLFTGTLYKRL